jgi:hypothetical protein
VKSKTAPADSYSTGAVPFPKTYNKSEVVKIALNALPVPDESTSWEQILEYRSDPDSRGKFLALRHWMSEVARAELTPAEVEEKFEYLIDQYQQHMRLHRMKTNVGTLETIVTTGAEFLGDLVSFKWGKAAEALFSLQTQAGGAAGGGADRAGQRGRLHREGEGDVLLSNE